MYQTQSDDSYLQYLANEIGACTEELKELNEMIKNEPSDYCRGLMKQEAWELSKHIDKMTAEIKRLEFVSWSKKLMQDQIDNMSESEFQSFRKLID